MVCPLMNVPEDICNSLSVHVLDFLKVVSLSNADDAGQLLEFVFAAIHSSQAKTACVKFAVAEEFVEVSQVFLVFRVKDLQSRPNHLAY